MTTCTSVIPVALLLATPCSAQSGLTNSTRRSLEASRSSARPLPATTWSRVGSCSGVLVRADEYSRRAPTICAAGVASNVTDWLSSGSALIRNDPISGRHDRDVNLRAAPFARAGSRTACRSRVIRRADDRARPGAMDPIGLPAPGHRPASARRQFVGACARERFRSSFDCLCCPTGVLATRAWASGGPLFADSDPRMGVVIGVVS